MRFSDEQLELAFRLRRQGLSWQPKAGDYVYDRTGFCKQSSPFQEKVYFILNYDYFVRTVGGIEVFKDIMVWLPTWADLRIVLADLGVSNREVAEQLRVSQAIENGEELTALYRMTDSRLSANSVHDLSQT